MGASHSGTAVVVALLVTLVQLVAANGAHAEVVPAGGSNSRAARPPAPAEPKTKRAAIAQGARAVAAHVDDDAALDADHAEDTVRYNPKKPLTISGRMTERCREHLPYVERAAAKVGLDPWLLLAVAWVESGFSPAIVSPAGSIGLMQLQPATSRVFGCRRPSDPQCGADAAALFIRALLRKFSGDVVFALCAYHAGPARPARSWRRGEVPANLHYATRVLEAKSRLERFGCVGRLQAAAK